MYDVETASDIICVLLLSAACVTAVTLLANVFHWLMRD